MNRTAIVKKLVTEGQRIFKSRATFIEFTKVAEPDQLLNDLKNFPHAFVLGCIMDRQMKAERAWSIPYLISRKLSDFRIKTLARLSRAEVLKLMSKPEPLHRFTEQMSENFYQAIQMILKEYSGDAAKIWSGKPSSAEVVYRFLKFRGIGPKIATMATNILARDFKIKFSDYYSIDLSVDVHVRRVFTRLGLSQPADDVNSVIYLARALHPEFPGLLDFPAWEIGRNWCRSNEMLCKQCSMSKLCPTANSK